jgi:hypothetical protein
MSLLNANFMGLYVYDGSSSTEPYKVYVSDDNTDTFDEAVEAFFDAEGNNAVGFLVTSDKVKLFQQDDTNLSSAEDDRPAFGRVLGSSGSATDFEDYTADLALAAAATNTSIDISRTVDEVVAKGVQCESETYTSLGAASWTVQCDGLIQGVVAGTERGATNLMDLARNKEYVVVRFVTNINQQNAIGDYESGVNYLGQGFIESISLTGSFDSTQTYSATIRGYGNLFTWYND